MRESSTLLLDISCRGEGHRCAVNVIIHGPHSPPHDYDASKQYLMPPSNVAGVVLAAEELSLAAAVLVTLVVYSGTPGKTPQPSTCLSSS